MNTFINDSDLKIWIQSENFSPLHLSEYTDMTIGGVTQCMSVHFSGNIETLRSVLAHVSADIKTLDDPGNKTFRLFSAIDVVVDDSVLTLEVSRQHRLLKKHQLTYFN